MLPTLADSYPPSWDLVADLQIILHYHFMQNAYLAGTLVAIIAGAVGYFMVLRGQSFAGHSLAHVGFAGATGAALLGIAPIIGLFVAGIAAALGIHALGSRARVGTDIATGAMHTFFLALGFLFVHLSSAQDATSIYTVLFGSVLGISDIDVRVTLWTALAVMIVLALLARPLLFASIDPEVAAARGVPVRALSLTFLVVLGGTVAVAVQIVGVLLIFALLVTPAAIAQRLSAQPARCVVLALGCALIFTWLGLAVAFFTPYPVGFFITSFAFGTYLIVRGAQWAAAQNMQPNGGLAG